MNLIDFEKTILKFRKSYFEKHFKNPKNNLDKFINTELRKATISALKAYMRFFLLESCLEEMKVNRKYSYLLKELNKICNLFEYFLELEEKILKI